MVMGKITVILGTILLISTSLRAAPPPGFVPSGHQWYPCSVVRYSDPLKLSGTIGAINMRLLPRGRYHGFFAQIEPGAGGGKLTGGWRYGKTSYLPIYALGASVSLMRTWGNPLGDVPADQTYVGSEVTASLAGIWLSAGAFTRLTGDNGGKWIYTLGIGAGI